MQRVRDPLVDLRVDGTRLRSVRLRAQLTQEEVAKCARITGHWLRRIELHGAQPSRPLVEDIALALSVPLSAFCDVIDDDEVVA